LNSRTIGMLFGVLLIIIALILGALQHFYYGPNNQSLYGSDANKWYFYGLVGVIGLVGIILAAWYFMKTEQPQKAAQ
jgi:hypothetical protein